MDLYKCRRLSQGSYSHTCRPLRLVAAGLIICQASAWVLPRPSPHLPPLLSKSYTQHSIPGLTSPKKALHASSGDEKSSDNQDDNNQGGPLGFLLNPYESKIPPELKDEIYRAEANTPAARDRGVRVITYVLIAVVGVLMAFFSAIVTEIRTSPLPPGVEPGSDPLAAAGLNWINTNFLAQFLFTNKIGGALCLFAGAGAGLLAEAELDTKRINAEKIYEELERRRKQSPSSAKKKSKSGSVEGTKKGKKRRSGKEQKRLQALSEIVETEQQTAEAQSSTTSTETEESTPSEPGTDTKLQKESEDGLLGKIKGFYEKADAMAAAQARLLNKELEDKGLVEKITDETGLRVIGREEASKMTSEKEKQVQKNDINNTEESKKEL